MANLLKVDPRNHVNETLVNGLKVLLQAAEDGDLTTGCFFGYGRGGDLITIIAKSSDIYRDMAAGLRMMHRLQTLADDNMRDYKPE